MGALFWWNFWNVVAIVGVAAVITATTIWLRRRSRS